MIKKFWSEYIYISICGELFLRILLLYIANIVRLFVKIFPHGKDFMFPKMFIIHY